MAWSSINPLVNILVIEENITLYETIGRSLERLIPGARAESYWHYPDGLIVLKHGQFQIVVLGTNARHDDADIKWRCAELKAASGNKAKIVLFAEFDPNDPVALGVNHIVKKPRLEELAVAVESIIVYTTPDQPEGRVTA